MKKSCLKSKARCSNSAKFEKLINQKVDEQQLKKIKGGNDDSVIVNTEYIIVEDQTIG